jgi:hypothetical protein
MKAFPQLSEQHEEVYDEWASEGEVPAAAPNSAEEKGEKPNALS